MLNQYRHHAGQFSVELAQIQLKGADVFSFLQAQSTLNVANLPGRSFHLMSFLDPQGRVESYGWILKQGEKISYLVAPSLVERSLERLNKFLISEDVEMSAPEIKSFVIILGPHSKEYASDEAASGVMFEEPAHLQSAPHPDLPLLRIEERELWRSLNGWPSFDGSDFTHEILNNLRLFDLSLSSNKGCYPGQETVSKIATRRGAAYSPVLVKIREKVSAGEITSFGKKIGTAFGCHEWQEDFYLTATLLRDFRVENMQLEFTLQDKNLKGLVKYYPLLSGDPHEKAQELFYEGTEAFKQDALSLAEEKFRQAIDLSPTFADAYESLGVMLGRMERFQEAIELMEKLSAIDPRSVLAHTNMSLYLMRLGRIEEAEEQKSLATVKSFQTFGEEAKKKELESQLKQKQEEEWAQRESMFLQVLEIDPEDTLANYGLGSIAVERRDWAKAQEHLERVLKHDPKYSVAYLALGRALKGLGLMEEAKSIWREGIKVSAAKGDLMPANQMQQELNF